MILHVVILWGTCIAAVVAALATSRGPGPRAIRGDMHLIRLVLPFAILAGVEALLLTASGHVIYQWLAPLVATLVVAAATRSARVLRVAWRSLVLVAFLTYGHAMFLRSLGWAGMPPMALHPSRHADPDWYTPLTGLRVVR